MQTLVPIGTFEARAHKLLGKAIIDELDTLKGWEQGKRTPDVAAANFLRMIKADPEFVQRTLTA